MPRSPLPIMSHEVEAVIVQLSYRILSSTQDLTKKKPGAVPKGKLESKNKEFRFTFKSSEANYLSFLSELLKKHGYDKYAPVVKECRFGIKVGIGGKKAKKDAINVDNIAEYKELAQKILEETPAKLIIFVALDDVKKASKNGKNAVDRELGRLSGLLEKKYQNPTDNGYTFVTNNGEKMPLTPAMMSKWVRAMYDGNATIQYLPNTQSFDPKMRTRSLFQTPKNSGGSTEGLLHSISSILHDARAIITGDTNVTVPVMPSNARPIPNPSSPTILMSPPKPSPSKLPAFLKYAQEHLGVKNATNYEFNLEEKGYGPDILQYIKDEAIESCGVSAGDAVRLKRGAAKWWSSPEAKRTRNDPVEVPAAASEPVSIHFEKRSHEGGSMSVFGPRIVEGENRHPEEYDWWYFNQFTRNLEKVPDGMVPQLYEEYISDPEW